MFHCIEQFTMHCIALHCIALHWDENANYCCAMHMFCCFAFYLIRLPSNSLYSSGVVSRYNLQVQMRRVCIEYSTLYCFTLHCISFHMWDYIIHYITYRLLLHCTGGTMMGEIALARESLLPLVAADPLYQTHTFFMLYFFIFVQLYFTFLTEVQGP